MGTRQLILIRQFFGEARLTPAAETPFLRIRRTTHLDLCVELALNAIVRDHGTPDEQNRQGGPRDLIWQDLWTLANDVSQRKCGKTLPERSALKTLHELRNLAQHRGTAPGADEVRDRVEPVRTLLEFVCRDFYGLDFEQLREWDELQHEPLRLWLEECHKALDEGELLLAAAGCQLAFQRIVVCVGTAAAGPNAAALLGRTIPVQSPEIAEALRGVLGTLREVTLALESELVAVSLGLPIADHFRFRWAAHGVEIVEYDLGRWMGVRTRLWPSDSERARGNARFMLDYLGKACVLLESAFPGALAELKLPSGLHASHL